MSYKHIDVTRLDKDILPKVNFKDQSSDNIEMPLRGWMIKQVNFGY